MTESLTKASPISVPTYSPFDLHSHMTASDGLLSPEELVDLAIHNNVETLAITDHDTIAGYLSVCDEVKEAGDIKLIAGVEISTTWNGASIHIVGLDFDPHHSAMTGLLTSQAEARQSRCHQILEKLSKLGMPLDYDELIEKTGHTHIGRPHIARLLIDKGYVNNMNKAFNKYLGAGKPGDIKNEWVSLSDTISTISKSGGVAVIAHPDKYKMTRTKSLRFVDDFVEFGGRAIEVISGKQHRDVTQKYAQIANDKGLLASVGTDFHQHISYGISLGQAAPLPDDVTPVWSEFQR